MDSYQVLRYLHIMGFIFLGGGLLGVFVSEWRGYSATRTVAFAEASLYTATLYDFLVLPGALTMMATGPLLIYKLGLGYFDAPWLVGMWGLFLFEFIEGNTVTRIQFRRTLRITRALPEDEPLTEEKRNGARSLAGQFAHFLDLPLFSVIVYCGVFRPDRWLQVGSAIGIAIAAALALAVIVPRAARSTTGAAAAAHAR